MAGKTYRVDVYYLGVTDPVRANLYLNTTLVKARARAIRDYGSMLKSGSTEVRIQETGYDRPMMLKGPETYIRFNLVTGKFYCRSYRDDGHIHMTEHNLNKDGTLGAVIKKERY